MEIPPHIVEMMKEDGADERKTVEPDDWKREPAEILHCECGRPVKIDENFQITDSSTPEAVMKSLEWAEYLYQCECGVFVYLRIRSRAEIQAFASFEPGKEG